MADPRDEFLAKAFESLESADADVAAGRYNSAANRCYYACYQAAVAALSDAGIGPSGGRFARWSHEALQAQFVGQLINRRKRYPSALREVMAQASSLRQKADYTATRVSEIEAQRILRRAREFVRAVHKTEWSNR